MQTIKLGQSNLSVPRIATGCMRISDMSAKEIQALVNGVMDLGINFFDHADIYSKGECESVFADAMNMTSSLREKMFIQSKCGINVPDGTFDFRKSYIIDSVNGSLKRLKTDYLDILLLHRPDTLCEPEEVAAAFDQLEKEGKVRHFGVSNQNPLQMQLLETAVKQPLIANQLQLSLAFTPMIDQGFNNNMQNDAAVIRDGSILEYCRLKNVTIQAWSPFQYGMFEGVFLGSEKYPELNALITKMAKEKSVTPEAISVAWILRHPAKMQVVLGSTNLERIKGITAACDIELSHKEWYDLYKAAGNVLP